MPIDPERMEPWKLDLQYGRIFFRLKRRARTKEGGRAWGKASVLSHLADIQRWLGKRSGSRFAKNLQALITAAAQEAAELF